MSLHQEIIFYKDWLRACKYKHSYRALHLFLALHGDDLKKLPKNFKGAYHK